MFIYICDCLCIYARCNWRHTCVGWHTRQKHAHIHEFVNIFLSTISVAKKMRNQTQRQGRMFLSFLFLDLRVRIRSLLQADWNFSTGEFQKNRRCTSVRGERGVYAKCPSQSMGEKSLFPRRGQINIFSNGIRSPWYLRTSLEFFDGLRDNIVLGTTRDLSVWRHLSSPLQSCDRYVCVCMCLRRTRLYAWLDREAPARGWRWYPLDWRCYAAGMEPWRRLICWCQPKFSNVLSEKCVCYALIYIV